MSQDIPRTSRSLQAPRLASAGAGSHALCRASGLGVVRAAGEYSLVATLSIATRTRLFRIEGELTSRPSRYSVQIGQDLHVDLGGGKSTEEILDRYFWRFMNHSCEPNTKVRGRQVVALRAIAPWECVTFDYNTTEYDMAEPFRCRCGSARCLGEIRGFRHLTASQRERRAPLLARHLTRYDFPAPAATAPVGASLGA